VKAGEVAKTNGTYTISYGSPFADTNYTVSAEGYISGTNDKVILYVTGKTTSGFTIVVP